MLVKLNLYDMVGIVSILVLGQVNMWPRARLSGHVYKKEWVSGKGLCGYEMPEINEK